MFPEHLRKLYPFESHWLDLGGIKLHYLDEGTGAPVVMLHGNPTWSFYWRELVKALRGTHRCIVPDHIGMGLSDKPGDARYTYTLESRVRDLERLLEHAGVRENVTLLLHDWGGMIGMAWAARHPEAVKRLVILNTAAFHLPKSKPFPWQLWLARTPLGALLVRGLNLFARGAVKDCVSRRTLPPDVRDALLYPFDSWANRIAVLRFVQDIPLKASDPAYELVSKTERNLELFRGVPMQIFWGLRDFVFDKHFLDEWVRRFPEAEIKRFEDCGHYILEDATEEIVPRVQAFLQTKTEAKAAT